MYNISRKTFAPFKVVWRTMGSSIDATVLEATDDKRVGKKTLIHKNTVISVSLDDKSEAHYLCAVLNSALVNFVARSYSVKGGKSFGSANLLGFIAIPKYASSNAIHQRLAALSQQAHALAAQTSEVSETSEVSARLAAIEAEIDLAAAKLWGISENELAEIRKSLQEL
jgi:hypothetical protein